MKAIYYTRYGSPSEFQLKEVEKPVPGKKEVLVKIHAASVNSWDWDLLKGHHFIIRLLSGLFRPKHKILGADIAGVVEAVGAEVSFFKPGDEVFGDIAGGGFGGFAEYATAPEKLLAKKPASISFEQAASLPQAGLLAIQGLRYRGELRKGDEILINGAGGGVGTIGLQYAKNTGAQVTCVDREEKFALLRSLGADQCIDFTKEDYTRTGKQYDKILDVIAHRRVRDYKRALKPTGIFSMIGGSMGWLLLNLLLFHPIFGNKKGKKLGLMGYRVSREALDELGAWVEKGMIKPVIDRVYPLEETAAAFHYFGLGKVQGKIIISVAQ